MLLFQTLVILKISPKIKATGTRTCPNLVFLGNHQKIDEWKKNNLEIPGLKRRLFAQQLLDHDVKGWLHPEHSGSRFWKGLRWGGAGFVLAWILANL